MISIEELHGRVLNRLDMTRDISDEELTLRTTALQR